jgi:hypothetical protein
METFEGYYWRVLTRIGKDAYAWARDNVLVAGCIAVIPPIAAYIKDRSHGLDWPVLQTTVWLYGVVFLVYVGYHAIRAPWKLNQEPIAALPVLSLKDTTHGLSVEILDFIYARNKDAPPQSEYVPTFVSDPMDTMQRIQASLSSQAAFKKYEYETLGIFRYRYAKKIHQTLKCLKDRNVSNDFLNQHAVSPNSGETIKLVGHLLLEIAEHLDDPLA